MGDFQPEDELKPDASDRPISRGRKAAPAPKLPVSKQHLMIAVGILILLLLVLGIGSAMNSPTSSANSAGQGAERNIDLAANSPASATDAATQTAEGSTPAQPSSEATASAATGAETTPAAGVDSSNPSQIPTSPSAPSQAASLPVTPATLDSKASLATPAAPNTPAMTQNPAPVATHSRPKVTQEQPAVSHPARPRSEADKPREASVRQKRAAEHPVVTKQVSQPALSSQHGYTLQLSSASREDTLKAWAKAQKLEGYRVYKTARNGEPWYVLVSGDYASPAAAKSAIASLPAAVKAKSPWVKPLSQVNKESAQ